MDEAKDQGPRHLAHTVLRALSLTETEPPEERRLLFFFDVLYQVSFQGESGRHFQGQVLWVGADSALHSSGMGCCTSCPTQCLTLKQPPAFNVGTLSALLPAVQGQDSLLVVSEAASGLVIHGIALNTQQPPTPGSFQVEIVGPAHLRVYVGLDSPLELRRNQLHTSALDVLHHGPVRVRLARLLEPLFSEIQPQLPSSIAASPLLLSGSLPLPGGGVLISENDWPELLEQFWVDALIRILGDVWEIRQPCLVLITGGRARALDERNGVTPPHQAEFSELRQLLEARAVQTIAEQVRAAEALSQAGSLGDVPHEALTHQDLGLRVDAAGAPKIARAVGFLAALARVDGSLLVLDARLNLVSFGGQVSLGALPETVHLAGDALATPSELSPVPVRSFGPRNQALLAQCFRDPEAIGFAFTQDGDVRAMLRQGDELIVWNHVQLSR